MSGPTRLTARAFSSSTGPPHSTASRGPPRRTSQGRPRQARPRSRIVQRPVIRRWLRSTRPPSNRSTRFFPTASTLSRRRPSRWSPTPVAAARGCGVSTSTPSPTRGWSRRAARWSESPSGMLPIVTERGLHPAAAGAVAATVWSALEPVDKRLLGCDYSDVAVLGKAVTRGRGWLPAGLALHAMNGALFGLAYGVIRRRSPLGDRGTAVAMALGEPLALSPL